MKMWRENRSTSRSLATSARIVNLDTGGSTKQEVSKDGSFIASDSSKLVDLDLALVSTIQSRQLG